MRVCIVSYYYDREIKDPDDLLDRYGSLTGWCTGLRDAGAEVRIVHRFGRDAVMRRDGIDYHFVHDLRHLKGPFDFARRINRTVVTMSPDVIHVNGMMFACQAARLKKLLPSIPVLLQDHADKVPSSVRRLILKPALHALDAVCFTTTEHASPWKRAGLLPDDCRIYEIMEGSTRFNLLDRDRARGNSGLMGDPLILWVGRLDQNKDPLTILKAFSLALQRLPGASLAMVYHDAPLLTAVQIWLRSNPKIARRVRMIGCVPHRELEAIYNSADLFALASHHEGSGYAALEALACGVTPVLSDIPSFRLMTGAGTMGGLFPAGDAGAASDQMVRWHSPAEPGHRMEVRRWFEEQFSFKAIGRHALDVYRTLADESRY